MSNMNQEAWKELKKMTEEQEQDMVNSPYHYQSYNKELNIECIDAMRAAFGDEAVSNFCICNAMKYVWRHQSKNGKQDIAKAIWYLNTHLELNP